VAAVEEARAEAEDLMKSMPFDESNSLQQRQDGGHARESRGSATNHRTSSAVLPPPLNQFSESTMGFDTENAMAVTPEDRVRQAERAAGLKDIPEYKRLLREKESQIEGLQKQFQSRMERAEDELGARDEDIEHYRTAMSEAERAVATLQQTIDRLEEASGGKDELIRLLKSRVQALEEELSRVGKSNLEKEIGRQEQVRMLNESISQLAAATKDRDDSISELKARTAELEDELAKAMEQLTSSREDLSNAERAVVSKDERLRSTEQELDSTKELLRGQMDLYKNEIASSLENTSRVMDLMSKEKDSLIDSLNAKIAMLEQSLAESEEERERCAARGAEAERELNDKIQRLALALTEKDGQIAGLRKEIEDGRKQTASRWTQTASSQRSSAGTQTDRILSVRKDAKKRDDRALSASRKSSAGTQTSPQTSDIVRKERNNDHRAREGGWDGGARAASAPTTTRRKSPSRHRPREGHRESGRGEVKRREVRHEDAMRQEHRRHESRHPERQPQKHPERHPERRMERRAKSRHRAHQGRPRRTRTMRPVTPEGYDEPPEPGPSRQPEGRYEPPTPGPAGRDDDDYSVPETYYDDARDDDVAVQYDDDDGTAAADEENGRRYHYVSPEEGDSIFDFSS